MSKNNLTNKNNLKTAIQLLKNIGNQKSKRQMHPDDIALRDSAQAQKFSWNQFFATQKDSHNRYSNSEYQKKDLALLAYRQLTKYIHTNRYATTDDDDLIISKHLIRCVGFVKATIITVIANKFLTLYPLWLAGYQANDIKVQLNRMPGVWIHITNQEIYQVSGILSPNSISKGCRLLRQQGLAIEVNNYWFLNLHRINYLVSKIKLPND